MLRLGRGSGSWMPADFDLAGAIEAGETTIVVPRGRHVLANPLVIASKITIRGTGTLAGSCARWLIDVVAGGELVIEGVTLVRTAKPGSVIRCAGKLTARRC